MILSCSVFVKSPDAKDYPLTSEIRMVKQIYQELTTKHAEKEKRKKRCLNFLDCCVSLFIVSPLVVGFWKGLWNNINYYHEQFSIFPVWECLIICYTLSSSIYYARDHLESFIINGNDNKVKSIYLKGIRRTIVYRIYHYIFAFSCIMIWRCLWEIIPIYAGKSIHLLSSSRLGNIK